MKFASHREVLCRSLCAGLMTLAACGGGNDAPVMGSGYVATSLVTDVNASGNPYSSPNIDAHLVNPWGIAFNPQGFVWVSDNATSTSTLYDGSGKSISWSENGKGVTETVTVTNSGSSAATYYVRVNYYAGGTGSTSGKYSIRLSW